MKNNKQINIHESLKNKMIDLCKNSITTFDDSYINKLANIFIIILEEILENILTTTKHNKICNVYAFSIEIAQSIAAIIEEFGFGETVNTNTTTNNVSKKIQDISKNIDQSSVIKGMNNLLTNSITNAMNSNTADIMSTIQAENKLSLAGVKGASFTLTDINQSASVSASTDASVTQKITSKIKNDIANNLTKNIAAAASNISSDISKQNTNEQEGSTAQGALVGVAEVIGDTYSNLADVAGGVLSFGSNKTTNTVTNTTKEDEFRTQFSLNSSFKVDQNNDNLAPPF